MLKLLNTKFLLAILAVLVAIASIAMYQRHEAAKAAAILEQQQRDAVQRMQEDEAFRKKVEADKKRHSSAAGNEGKTWKTYIP
jgi:chromatin segregation and condensation protein Rec8/ScpA/Scc1 (kleisin family)